MKFYNRVFSLSGMLKSGLLAGMLLASMSLYAQTESADKIVAIVGKDKIVLQSELDMQAMELKKNDPNFNDNMKCQLLQNMILQKLLVEQAERDSVIVTDDEAETELEKKLRYFISVYGSKEKMEQAVGKTIYQIKDENREAVKEQLIVQKMRAQILQNVKITPAEVRIFYNKNADSMPFLPATIEIGQVVIDPPVSQEMDDYARKKLEGIRKEIVEGGKSFETMAGIYSDDPGSRDNGGRYNDVSRTNSGMDPTFVNTAFKLQNGEVSQIIKTKFGYHIIQMIQRKGDEADIRHILIRPERTSEDFKAALGKLDTVRADLISGKIDFPQAVGKYSTDDAAKLTGGMVTDPQTGSSDIEISKLDPSMVLTIDSLKPGGYSQPQIFLNEQNEKSCRIVYLKSRTKPHKANLNDDYSKLEELALQQKQMQKLEEWIEEKLPSYYLKIDPAYQSCAVFKNWNLATK
ncbi:MAG TPA: peptidylprolyl isomerase [Flavipsychrobacter sp.]|nr:peptidylprolyl isomerase [Flavipsychrobacter sp.]